MSHCLQDESSSTSGESSSTEHKRISSDQTNESSFAHVSSSAENEQNSSSSPSSSYVYASLTTSYIEAAAAAAAAATNDKKRKHNLVASEPIQLEERRHQERLAANRRSAAISRQRKKDLSDQLRKHVVELLKKNAELTARSQELERQLQLSHQRESAASLHSMLHVRRADGPPIVRLGASTADALLAAPTARTGIATQLQPLLAHQAGSAFGAPGQSSARLANFGALQAMHLLAATQSQQAAGVGAGSPVSAEGGMTLASIQQVSREDECSSTGGLLDWEHRCHRVLY